MMVPPSSDAHVLYLRGRLLSFYSYCFFATGHQRRALWAFIQGVRPRRPYAALGARIARDLSGPFNAVHLRRSDLIIGIREYAGVSGAAIANNLAEVLPADETLLVCSEVDESDALFHPLRQRFNNVVFANTLILEDHRTAFFDLPRHEDNALGVVTQELAARSSTFVGTVGSTFTGMIQRAHLLREPEMKFLYTADYTPPGPRFERGQYLDRFDGAFSWNRIGYRWPPETLAWFREWPEAA
ncbi:MAG: hypothetical protein GY926_01335 [bacterium]|nr:hypothetical protein [bacterium]